MRRTSSFAPAAAQQCDDGTAVIRNTDGSDLAPHGGQSISVDGIPYVLRMTSVVNHPAPERSR